MSPLAAIALKLVGVITVVSALIDYIILLVPPQLTNAQWQLSTTTQIVDRGIVPLVGIAMLLTGFWIESNVGRSNRGQSLMTDLRFWSCVLASFLGLLFLVLTVVNINSVRLTSKQALEQVSTEASQASDQLEQRLNTQLSQQQNQLSALLQNEDALSQAIQSGQLPQGFEQYKDNPEGLNQFLQEQASQAKQRIATEIGSRREAAEQRVRTEAKKTGVRISISSLLLAIGYSVIGWLGLRRLLSLTRTA